MKYIIGLLGALIMALIVWLMNEYILLFKISDFLNGWWCCGAFQLAKDFYEENYQSKT